MCLQYDKPSDWACEMWLIGGKIGIVVELRLIFTALLALAPRWLCCRNLTEGFWDFDAKGSMQN